MKKRIVALILVVCMMLGITNFGYAVDVNATDVDLNIEVNTPEGSSDDELDDLTDDANLPATVFTSSDSGQDNTASSGIELSKEVLQTNNGYEITLKAFATGELNITTETTAVPTDIVLVLDQSGSMADPFTYEAEETYTAYTGSYYNSYSTPVYYKDENGEYKQLDVTKVWKDMAIGYTYTFSKEDGTVYHEKDVFLLGLLTEVSDSEGIYYKTVASSEIQRVEALKGAVENFVDEVKSNAAQNNVDHRLAIVGFASQSGYGNNTEVLTVEGNNSVYEVSGNTENTVGVAYNNATDTTYKNALVSCNAAIIDNAIAALATNGATRSDLGMEMAQKILAQNPLGDGENRNRVVIVFTDGSPTSSNSFETNVANSAISNAKTIKDTGATVYSIGIFDAANPDDLQASENKYMNYMSSNYPKAQSMDENGVSEEGGAIQTGYYLIANNQTSLKEIFLTISEEIEAGTSSSTLDSTSVIRDIIAPDFRLPENAIAEDIKVYTANCIGKTGDTFEFQPEAEWTSVSNPAVTINGKQIDVTGFNFQEEYVSEIVNNGVATGQFRGKEIIIRVPIVVESGCFGGNNIPTNAPGSGVYQSSNDASPLETFISPTVDIPINYKITGTEKITCIGTDVVQSDLIGSVSGFTLNGTNNANVNIVYTLTTGDGTEYKYTIGSGSTTGSWDTVPPTIESITQQQEYTLTATVTPIASGAVQAADIEVDSEAGAIQPVIRVLAPTITWKDTTVSPGTMVTPVSDNYEGVVWKDVNNGNVVSTDWTLTYSLTNNGNTTFAVTSETNFDVSVVVNGKDITRHVIFVRTNDSACGHSNEHIGSTSDVEFVIHITEFDITITKTVDEAPQQSFIFRITDGTGQVLTTIVMSPDEFSQSGDRYVCSKVVKNMTSSNYSVTEDTNWSWKYDCSSSVQNVGSTSSNVTFNNNRNDKVWVGTTDSAENIFDKKLINEKEG